MIRQNLLMDSKLRRFYENLKGIYKYFIPQRDAP